MAGVGKGPLEGIRVLKLAAGIAGPLAGRVLANLGAEVIKIESASRLWADHAWVPSWQPEAGLQLDWHPPMRNDYCAGDLGVGLELSHPRGLALFKDLVSISDAFIIAFGAPTASKLGIDYPDLNSVNPRLIYLNLTSFGVKGPLADFAVWGFNVVPMTGITSVVGYPDVAEPMGVGGITLADFSGGLCAALAVLVALHSRNETGKGQFIDESLVEVVASTSMGQPILDYLANGRLRTPAGNRSPDSAPQGVYRCRGEDRWCAITVHSEAEWQGFCRALANPGWADDARFSTLASRLEHHDELDRLTEQATSRLDPYEVMFLMQQEGVPAGVAQTTDDLLLRDLQLAARGFFINAPMTKQGNAITYDLPIKLSATPGAITRGAAGIGEDNDYVLRGLLGLSEREVDGLVQEGVVYPPRPGDPTLKDRSLAYRWTGSLASSLPRADRLRW